MEEINSNKGIGSDYYGKFHAPWFTVPRQPIVNVEHPFIIHNVDKGLATLGSSRRLQEVSPLKFRQASVFDGY